MEKTATKLTDSQRKQLISLLWDDLKQDKEHKDRKQTGYGTKTQIGLIASIESILIQEIA